MKKHNHIEVFLELALPSHSEKVSLLNLASGKIILLKINKKTSLANT